MPSRRCWQPGSFSPRFGDSPTVPPLPGAVPARLPLLAEVEHGAALRGHGLLTLHPGGSGTVAAEELVKGYGMVGMVHPHDPLAPRQVLDWLPLVSPSQSRTAVTALAAGSSRTLLGP
jgi:hypothetical protein